ncbi:MAG: hypothetical protein ACHQIM_10625, partial [Sphingobacteriales bacterium]
QNGVTIKTGSGTNNIGDSFTPDANGIYTITLNAECNGIKCPSCSYTISIKDCPTCNCGTWSPLTVNRIEKFECGGKNIIPWTCHKPFSFITAYQCSPNNESCQAKTEWVITQNGVAIKTGSGTNNIGDSFTPDANGIYIITLNASCNGIKCPPCSYTISIKDCPTCDCGNWRPLKVIQLGARVAGFECGSNIQWKCNQPFSFTSTYLCNSNGQSCRAIMSWEIARDGVSIKTGNGTNTITDSFTPTGNGAYTITLYAVCNGIKCPPCTYTVVVADCCNCGKWNPLKVQQAGGRALTFDCGSEIKWYCNKLFNFSALYQCSNPNDKSCQAITSWEITKDGLSIKTGNGTGTIADSFTPTGNGDYILTLNAICGGVKCPPCTYTLVVADCCSCGSWGTLNVPQSSRLVMQYKCGTEIPIRMSCNQPFNFTSSYQCSPAGKSCQPVTSWEITDGTTVLKTGTGTGSIAGSFTPTANGNYTITLNATCNGLKCPSCSYKAVVTNCKTCNCGTWGPLKVYREQYVCGLNIPWPCNQAFNFTNTYQCSNSEKNCQPVSTWVIKKDGVNIKTGSGAGSISDSFIPTANGTYTITLNAACNGIACSPCTYTVVVNDCTPQPCPILCNGDFEQILNGQAPTDYVQTSQNNIPCWKTTASDGLIEIWHTGFESVHSNTGTYFAELNATMVGTLYQTFTTPAKTVIISFAHRGRYSGVDVMKVSLVPLLGTAIPLGTYSDNNSGWTTYHTAPALIPAGTYKLTFESISSNGGKGPPDGGNFLDSVSITCTDGGANR